MTVKMIEGEEDGKERLFFFHSPLRFARKETIPTLLCTLRFGDPLQKKEPFNGRVPFIFANNRLGKPV